MQLVRPLALASLIVLVLSGTAPACSASGGSDPDGEGGAGATGGGGGLGAGGFDGGLDDGNCPRHCSQDLTKVLDCHGQPVEICPPDKACGASASCTSDPCGAAEQMKTTYGCDFWATSPDMVVDSAKGSCYAAFVANTWSGPVHIQVERGGAPLVPDLFARIPKGQGPGLTYEPYSTATGLPPGEVAILFLAAKPDAKTPCPVPPAIPLDSSIHGTGRGDAFHITTDRPIVAYQIFPYGGGPSAATSATLLLPTPVWGDNYVAINAYRKSLAVPEAQPSLMLLARDDATDVTISPVSAIVAGPGVEGTPEGTPITYSMKRGEVLQLTQDEELTGSAIQSTKPIAMFGAASCLNVKPHHWACDSAHQQIPPVPALGNEYVGVRYRGRTEHPDEAPPWRLVGAVDGTVLTWEPDVPPGAPVTLDLGTVAEFDHPGPFRVRSQDEKHPFYAAGYMQGAGQFGDSPIFNGEGDPEWVNLVPPSQYLSSYVFFTDPTYPETNLVLVRVAEGGAFADVTLDCAGVITGWTPIGPYEYARVDLVTKNFESVNGCANGRHVIESAKPFGLTVWGWGSHATQPYYSVFVSYAYPAGASVRPINDVVVIPTPK